jgi:hypothetical protein
MRGLALPNEYEFNELMGNMSDGVKKLEPHGQARGPRLFTTWEAIAEKEALRFVALQPGSPLKSFSIPSKKILI